MPIQDLESGRLHSNYERWRATFVGPIPTSTDSYKNALATHSFPAFKSWGDENNQRVRVYQQVLFDAHALLADKTREKMGLWLPGEPRRDAPKWRAAGLDAYVSAYVGVHDPYYAHSLDIGEAPFGVFLAKTCETAFQCVATRRDVASPQASADVADDVLTADDARELVRCECTLSSHESFWHYWGAPEYWINDPRYKTDMWKWKYEMHYLEDVELKWFEAILWPSIPEEDLRLGGAAISAVTEHGRRFSMAWPSCPVIYYDWKPELGGDDFLDASYTVAAFVASFGYFPKTLHDAQARIGNGSNARD